VPVGYQSALIPAFSAKTRLKSEPWRRDLGIWRSRAGATDEPLPNGDRSRFVAPRNAKRPAGALPGRAIVRGKWITTACCDGHIPARLPIYASIRKSPQLGF